MEMKLFIPIILGTSREGRQSERAAKWLLGEIERRADMKTTIVDVRDFALPQDQYGESIKDKFPEYRKLILRADGCIIVSPEYNHGYPGSLKSVLDLLLKEYYHKPVGMVGVSSGAIGGARMIEGLLHVVRELGMVSIFKDLHFARVGELFNDSGNIQDESYRERAQNFLDELVWMAKTLKWGRNNIPSRFRQVE